MKRNGQRPPYLFYRWVYFLKRLKTESQNSCKNIVCTGVQLYSPEQTALLCVYCYTCTLHAA